ncbi:MAG: glycerol-3-phosphate dehydrogenase subunit C [Hyphomicrobiaceae bacterium]
MIKATPTDGLCYNPSDAKYWDEKGLDAEIERVFDVCHGCRLCFNLCPSFPTLFDAVDRHDGDVRKLSRAENDAVVDDCYQCKLCYVKCPYTPDDKHSFQLDFPRLLLRYNAVRVKKNGLGLRERFLGDPITAGKIGSALAPVSNVANRTKAHRVLMEKSMGIHRDKQLPEFHRETFEKWRSKHADAPRVDAAASGEEVVLFHTCFVNFNNPGVGKAAIEVLEHNGVRVHTPAQGCCGMPAMDGGDIEHARVQARQNVATLAPYVARGMKVLAINPTCSYTMKKEYVDLVGPDMAADASALAAATRDLMEYLFELKREGKFERDFKTTPGDVAYHLPCHLKAQNIGYRSRDVMKLVPGTKVRVVDACCGHDGTWAMKTENFEKSMKVGKTAFEGMLENGEDGAPALMATDCPLAAIQFEQATGTRPIHPIEVLASAYRDAGFDTAVPEATPSPDNSRKQS